MTTQPVSVQNAPGWRLRRADLGRRLLHHLHERGMFRTWLRDEPEGWELVSGVWSPFYIQARHIPSHPEVLRFVGEALAEVVQHEIGACENLIGLATAGIPLATAAALKLGVPLCYTRKLPGIRSLDDLASRPKDYGDHSMVEGEIKDGARVVLVDDVCAQFTSKQIAHWQVTTEVRNRELRGVTVPAVLVLVDREQGSIATTAAAKLGMIILSVVKLKSEGLDLLRDVLSPREHEVISAYILDPTAFQDPNIRSSLILEARRFQSTRGI